MSELSAEEKRRLLRERRQAKLGQGNATNRLNQILSGSSVPAGAQSAEAVSGAVQGVPETTTQFATATNTPELSTATKASETGSGNASGVSGVSGSGSARENADSGLETPAKPQASARRETAVDAFADPDGPDISSLGPSQPENLDMDSLLQQIFAGPNGASAPQKDTADFFANMMKTMSEDGTDMPKSSVDASFHSKMSAYRHYQQKQLTARFAILRLIVHVAGFVYHYRTEDFFRSSAYSYIRNRMHATSSYGMFFMSAEIAFISAYYYSLSAKGLLSQASENNPITKLLSLASAVYPQATAYQPILNNLLVYWGGVSIIIGDLSLVVVMFGLASIFA